MEKVRLNAEEAFKCLAAYRKTGDSVARDLLYFDNLRRIYGIANEFKGLGISFDALVSEASMRFFEIVNNYDIINTNAESFDAYLEVSIRNAVSNYVQKEGTRNWLKGAKKLISLEDVDAKSYPLASLEEQFFGRSGR